MVACYLDIGDGRYSFVIDDGTLCRHVKDHMRLSECMWIVPGTMNFLED